MIILFSLRFAVLKYWLQVLVCSPGDGCVGVSWGNALSASRVLGADKRSPFVSVFYLLKVMKT